MEQPSGASRLKGSRRQTERPTDLPNRTLLASLFWYMTLALSGPAQARFYWDGKPVFSEMAAWEIVFFGAIILALAAALIFTLVKLIHAIAGKK